MCDVFWVGDVLMGLLGVVFLVSGGCWGCLDGVTG